MAQFHPSAGLDEKTQEEREDDDVGALPVLLQLKQNRDGPALPVGWPKDSYVNKNGFQKKITGQLNPLEPDKTTYGKCLLPLMQSVKWLHTTLAKNRQEVPSTLVHQPMMIADTGSDDDEEKRPSEHPPPEHRPSSPRSSPRSSRPSSRPSSPRSSPRSSRRLSGVQPVVPSAVVERNPAAEELHGIYNPMVLIIGQWNYPTTAPPVTDEVERHARPQHKKTIEEMYNVWRPSPDEDGREVPGGGLYNYKHVYRLGEALERSATLRQIQTFITKHLRMALALQNTAGDKAKLDAIIFVFIGHGAKTKYWPAGSPYDDTRQYLYYSRIWEETEATMRGRTDVDKGKPLPTLFIMTPCRGHKKNAPQMVMLALGPIFDEDLEERVPTEDEIATADELVEPPKPDGTTTWPRSGWYRAYPSERAKLSRLYREQRRMMFFSTHFGFAAHSGQQALPDRENGQVATADSGFVAFGIGMRQALAEAVAPEQEEPLSLRQVFLNAYSHMKQSHDKVDKGTEEPQQPVMTGGFESAMSLRPSRVVLPEEPVLKLPLPGWPHPHPGADAKSWPFATTLRWWSETPEATPEPVLLVGADPEDGMRRIAKAKKEDSYDVVPASQLQKQVNIKKLLPAQVPKVFAVLGWRTLRLRDRYFRHLMAVDYLHGENKDTKSYMMRPRVLLISCTKPQGATGPEYANLAGTLNALKMTFEQDWGAVVKELDLNTVQEEKEQEKWMVQSVKGKVDIVGSFEDAYTDSFIVVAAGLQAVQRSDGIMFPGHEQQGFSPIDMIERHCYDATILIQVLHNANDPPPSRFEDLDWGQRHGPENVVQFHVRVPPPKTPKKKRGAPARAPPADLGDVWPHIDHLHTLVQDRLVSWPHLFTAQEVLQTLQGVGVRGATVITPWLGGNPMVDTYVFRKPKVTELGRIRKSMSSAGYHGRGRRVGGGQWERSWGGGPDYDDGDDHLVRLCKEHIWLKAQNKALQAQIAGIFHSADDLELLCHAALRIGGGRRY